MEELEKMLAATLTGMTVDVFKAEAKKWIASAKDPRWKRPYTELTYKPMNELLGYLRDNGFKTYIVTGGGQDFVRVYSEKIYGIPPEQVVGIGWWDDLQLRQGRQADPDQGAQAASQRQQRRQAGRHPSDDRTPARVRPSAIRPATGKCLNTLKQARAPRFAMLVLHDDAEREYAYGPAQGLPDTKVGAFTQELYDEANEGWLAGCQHEEGLGPDPRFWSIVVVRRPSVVA